MFFSKTKKIMLNQNMLCLILKPVANMHGMFTADTF